MHWHFCQSTTSRIILVRSLIITLALNIGIVQGLLWYFDRAIGVFPKVFGFGRWELWDTKIRYDQAGTILGLVWL